MPLETATYTSDLVTSNPAASDPLSGADDHIRLIKATLKNTFPNFNAAALASTQAQIDAVTALLVGGVLRANGAVPAGAIMDFARTSPPPGWLECNGSAVPRSTYADLFTAIGTTWGAGDGSTTFNLPPDRFRRGRNAAGVAVGTLQADQNKTHTHTGSGTTGTEDTAHAHNFSGTTTTESVTHTHGINGVISDGTAITASNYVTGPVLAGRIVNPSTGTQSAFHTHNYSGVTSGETAAHAHGYSFTTSAGSADGSEARPLSQSVLTCIRT